MIINIDEARVVLDECKIFADNSDDTQITFQAVDPNQKNRMVQVTITKVAEEAGDTKKG